MSLAEAEKATARTPSFMADNANLTWGAQINNKKYPNVFFTEIFGKLKPYAGTV